MMSRVNLAFTSSLHYTIFLLLCILSTRNYYHADSYDIVNAQLLTSSSHHTTHRSSVSGVNGLPQIYGDATEDTSYSSSTSTLSDLSTCFYEIHNHYNSSLLTTLRVLRDTTFFKVFKVNLYSDCQFWHESHQCMEIGCSVCGQCNENDLPAEWTTYPSVGLSNHHTTNLTDIHSDHDSMSSGSVYESRGSVVDVRLPSNIKEWKDENESTWTIVQDDRHCSSHDIVYIDMSLNPEGYTGYEGPSAHRIWRAIYEENCFTSSSNTTHISTSFGSAFSDDQCYERRVFYKLISGIHSTISAHIAYNYPTNKQKQNNHAAFSFHHDTSSSSSSGDTSPSLDVYMDKLGAYPDRLNNLYFTWTVVGRAVQKAKPLLYTYNYTTGNSTEDHIVVDHIQELLDDPTLNVCSREFDERLMFADDDNNALENEFQQHFHNVSKIIDCVGCEKCRLHGKLQLLGLGTALRVLFDDGDVTFTRNELMALITTLGKLTEALNIVQYFQSQQSSLSASTSTTTGTHRNIRIPSLTSNRKESSTIIDQTYVDLVCTAAYMILPALLFLTAYMYLATRAHTDTPTGTERERHTSSDDDADKDDDDDTEGNLSNGDAHAYIPQANGSSKGAEH